MRAFLWICYAIVITACSSDGGPTTPPPPPLSVTADITKLTGLRTSNAYLGCEVVWRSTSSDDTLAISYRINTGNLDRFSQPEPPITGTYQDTVRVTFVIDPSGVYVDPHTVSWEVRRVRGDSLLGSGFARIRQDHTIDPYCWL